MKIIKMLLLVSCFVCTFAIAQGNYTENERYAIRMALEDVTANPVWKKDIPKGETVGLLPLFDDVSDYSTEQLKNAITASGVTCVEAKNSEFWDEIMSEVEWDTLKEDMLDSKTLVKFGKLKGVKYLVYGSVVDVKENTDYTYVEIALHLSSLETKQHIWGGTFVERYYTGKDKIGIIALDSVVKDTLKEAIQDATESVKQSSKLKDVGTVAVYAIAGDIDDYVLGLVNDMFSKTKIITKNLDVGTMAEAEWTLKESPDTADAILCGAVRELSKKLVKEEAYKKTFEVEAEVQLSIETVDGDVLWSSTASATRFDVEEDTTGFWDSLSITLKEAFDERPLQIVMFIVIGLLVFIALIMFFRATRRVR